MTGNQGEMKETRGGNESEMKGKGTRNEGRCREMIGNAADMNGK